MASIIPNINIYRDISVLLTFLLFYTKCSLIQGHLEVSYYLRLSLSLSKCHIILVLLAFLYLEQSDKRSKLRILWSLLGGLCWSLKYHVISISLHFSISTSLAQGYLKASYYLKLHFTFLLSQL